MSRKIIKQTPSADFLTNLCWRLHYKYNHCSSRQTLVVVAEVTQCLPLQTDLDVIFCRVDHSRSEIQSKIQILLMPSLLCLYGKRRPMYNTFFPCMSEPPKGTKCPPMVCCYGIDRPWQHHSKDQPMRAQYLEDPDQ